MAQYNFEGDFTSLSERQLEFVNKVLSEQDLKVKKVVFKAVGQAGDNFIGNVKRILIEGENGCMSMIVKVAASNEMTRMMTNTEIVFNNEHVMYTEVLPTLVQLQKEAGVPEEDYFRYAKCYGSLNVAPHELIILEDLNESGFFMLNKFESLSNECVRSVLKNFASFHSLSYALQKREPEKYEQIKEKLTDVWSITFVRPEFTEHTKIMECDTMSLLDDESHKNLLKNKLSNMVHLRSELLRLEDHRHSVIQQGDAWTNNIMFKVGDESAQSIMIDYQMSTTGNPVMDLIFMIFNCTDHEIRSKNYYDWIDYYHSELDKALSNFGLKANLIYPRDELDADLKRYAEVMFFMCIFFTNLLMRDTNEASEVLEAMKKVSLEEAVETMKTMNLQGATILRIKTKVLNLIASFKEFGLL